jgi:PBP1b-binding outer membrane lipoprotein LpoB
MRRWILLAALALFVCGCSSVDRPKKEKKEQTQEIGVPNGEGSPFGP